MSRKAYLSAITALAGSLALAGCGPSFDNKLEAAQRAAEARYRAETAACFADFKASADDVNAALAHYGHPQDPKSPPAQHHAVVTGRDLDNCLATAAAHMNAANDAFDAAFNRHEAAERAIADGFGDAAAQFNANAAAAQAAATAPIPQLPPPPLAVSAQGAIYGCTLGYCPQPAARGSVCPVHTSRAG